MNKQEMVIEAKKWGIEEKHIEELIDAYSQLIKEMPQISFQELLKQAVKTQDELKHKPKDAISIGSDLFDI
jgi:hypothetical protein